MRRVDHPQTTTSPRTSTDYEGCATTSRSLRLTAGRRRGCRSHRRGSLPNRDESSPATRADATAAARSGRLPKTATVRPHEPKIEIGAEVRLTGGHRDENDVFAVGRSSARAPLSETIASYLCPLLSAFKIQRPRSEVVRTKAIFAHLARQRANRRRIAGGSLLRAAAIDSDGDIVSDRSGPRNSDHQAEGDGAAQEDERAIRTTLTLGPRRKDDVRPLKTF